MSSSRMGSITSNGSVKIVLNNTERKVSGNYRKLDAKEVISRPADVSVVHADVHLYRSKQELSLWRSQKYYRIKKKRFP